MLLNKQQGNPNSSSTPTEPLTGAGDTTNPTDQPRSLRTAKIVCAILLVAIIAAAVLRNLPNMLPGKPAAPKEKPPAPVRVTKVISGDAPLQIEAIGNVEPIQTVSIRSQVAGQIQKVFFTEGQDVRKGDMLFAIDPRPFEAAVMQAEANQAKDMAQVKQARANMAKDQFQVRQAEANLARDTAQERNAYKQFTRYKLLVGEGAVSQEQSDQMRTNAEALTATMNADKAAIENATANLDADKASIDNYKAVVKADSAFLDNQRVQLGYCSIRSPIDGRTGSVLVHIGNIVKANEGDPLVVVNQIHPIYISFAVPEKNLPTIKEHNKLGQLSVETFPADEHTKPIKGKLTFFENAVDATTGTIKLKATFDNADGVLWPGRFDDIVLTLSTEKATLVPSQAVQQGPKGDYVWVVKPDNTVEMRAITIARTQGNQTVIESGVQPGETVVLDGQLQLTQGRAISIAPSGN